MSRPSREQRLADAEAKAHDELAAKRKALAQVQAERRAAAKKARDKRRYQVGTLVEEAGLADVDDAVLRPLLSLLTTIAAVPNPVALLEALLVDVCGSPGTAVPAYGHPADGVSPLG